MSIHRRRRFISSYGYEMSPLLGTLVAIIPVCKISCSLWICLALDSGFRHFPVNTQHQRRMYLRKFCSEQRFLHSASWLRCSGCATLASGIDCSPLVQLDVLPIKVYANWLTQVASSGTLKRKAADTFERFCIHAALQYINTRLHFVLDIT
ncbi:uncharacterized protein MYCFIDRAFT_178515 [Pseudocercospora fijiensis CIRAD86]|uniref:Uncharacterized protein n=1 Tax=Pseudocercospora fijiensis (strain CIRAD86) TaxID=383855 RepID=M3AMM0_PSEFD|nr:uncharacterized protein MYCFIDRAFT_178515 [Pseudocercospora fijiensis CIRAD86]EME78368.1 hypothetical protein MYCFIDRAFT_178515 [Pseudocercospora fijiensis CIRAD86]